VDSFESARHSFGKESAALLVELSSPVARPERHGTPLAMEKSGQAVLIDLCCRLTYFGQVG